MEYKEDNAIIIDTKPYIEKSDNNV